MRAGGWRVGYRSRQACALGLVSCLVSCASSADRIAIPRQELEYRLRYLPAQPMSRTEHIAALARSVDRAGAGWEGRFVGRSIGVRGARGLVLWLGSLSGVGAEWERDHLAMLVGPERGHASAMDLALALKGVAASVLVESEAARQVFGDRYRWRGRREIERQVATLIACQGPHGVWGGAIDSAWCIDALEEACAVEPELLPRVRQACERVSVFYRSGVPSTGTGLRGSADDVHRLHEACVRSSLARVLGHDHMQGDWDSIASMVRSCALGREPVSLASWAFAFWKLGPSSAISHPCANAREAVRQSYYAEELLAESIDELAETVVSIELFGYDDFGAISGYLPETDARW